MLPLLLVVCFQGPKVEVNPNGIAYASPGFPNPGSTSPPLGFQP